MKLFLTTLAITTLFAVTLPVFAAADIENLKNSLNASADRAGLDKTPLTIAIGRPIGYLFAIVGTLFLVMSVTGGFLWMTAGGSEEKVHRAKGFIIGGVNGLIVMFFAYALVYVVLSALGYATSG